MRTRIAVTQSSTFSDKRVEHGIVYYYWLKAVDTSGNKSDYSLGTFNIVNTHTASILRLPAYEYILPGSFINICAAYGATPYVRPAIATEAGKEAHGFVLEAPVDNLVTVYLSGCVNTKVLRCDDGGSLLTGGYFYLSDSQYGAITMTPPTGEGHLVQKIGVPVTIIGAPMSLLFLYHEPVIVKAP